MRSEGLLQSVGLSVCWFVGRFVGRSVLHVFSRTVAAVDTKRGYVGTHTQLSSLYPRHHSRGKIYQPQALSPFFSASAS